MGDNESRKKINSFAICTLFWLFLLVRSRKYTQFTREYVCVSMSVCMCMLLATVPTKLNKKKKKTK